MMGRRGRRGGDLLWRTSAATVERPTVFGAKHWIILVPRFGYSCCVAIFAVL
jgi:hypothetical protein